MSDKTIDAALQLLADIGEERMKARFPHLYKLAMKTQTAVKIEKELAALEKQKDKESREVHVKGYVRNVSKRGPYRKSRMRKAIAEITKAHAEAEELANKILYL